MPVDIGQAISLGIKLAILGVIIWIAVTLKKWWNSPGDRPTWVVSIVNMFQPVSYKKLTGLSPLFNSNVVTIADSSPTSNACASNCSMVSTCNGFFFSNNVCKQISSDFGTIVMVPSTGDTYVKSTSNTPKWGFMLQNPGVDYAFDSNVSSQHYGSLINETDPTLIANTCIQQATSNCVGFSTNTSTKQTWLVNSTSNNATTSNVTSYSYGIIPSYAFTSQTL